MPTSPLPLIVLLLTCICCNAQEFVARTVASNLQTPWEIVWGPDGQLYVTEFSGRISRIDPATGHQTVLIEKVPDYNRIGEGGLMGLALAPDFETSHHLYAGYTYRENANDHIKVMRWKIVNNALTEQTTIISRARAWWSHDGCRLAFDTEGKLFITFGDASQGSDAQNLNSLNGKTLRVHADGSIPADNPFGSAVWSLGHRNHQGLTFGPNGILYSSEHGTSGDDEINIIERGRNYGWPTVEGFCDDPPETTFCASANVKEPIGIVWTPTIAPGQLIYYNGSLFPQWKDHLMVIGMKSRSLILLTLNESRTLVTQRRTVLENTYGRLRSVCQSPDGRVFIGSSNHDNYGDKREGSDWIIELTPKPSSTDDEDEAAANGLSIIEGVVTINSIEPGSVVSVFDMNGRQVATVSELFIDTVSFDLYEYSNTPLILQWTRGDLMYSRLIIVR